MSSSFVKDCCDSSGNNSSSSNKTVIIIVNNETGGVSLDGNELQNLLASHGADTSQVSVVQMGGAGEAVGSPVGTNVATTDTRNLINPPGLPVNFNIGYPSIPLEASAISGYAELPIDADALQSLESVFETAEAREILGEPLLNMINNPNNLAENFDQMILPAGDAASNKSSPRKLKGSPPKRRSQRQMDKAERDEVEKIKAENQKMLREEREQLKRAQEEEEEKERMKENEAIEEDEEDQMGTGKGINKGVESEMGGKELPNHEEGEKLKTKKGIKTKNNTTDKVFIVTQDKNTVSKEASLKRLSVQVEKLNPKDMEMNRKSRDPVIPSGDHSTGEDHNLSSSEEKQSFNSLSSPPDGSSMHCAPDDERNPQTGSRISNNINVVKKTRRIKSCDKSINDKAKRSDVAKSSRTCDINNGEAFESDTNIPKTNSTMNSLMTNKHFSDVESPLSNALETPCVTSGATPSKQPPIVRVTTPVEAQKVVDRCITSSAKKDKNVPPISDSDNNKRHSSEKRDKNDLIMLGKKLKKEKISFENQLLMGNLSNKLNKNLLLKNNSSKNISSDSSTPTPIIKDVPKNSILKQSPSISKSLMNYKIPLKKSAVKRNLEFKENCNTSQTNTSTNSQSLHNTSSDTLNKEGVSPFPKGKYFTPNSINVNNNNTPKLSTKATDKLPSNLQKNTLGYPNVIKVKSLKDDIIKINSSVNNNVVTKASPSSSDAVNSVKNSLTTNNLAPMANEKKKSPKIKHASESKMGDNVRRSVRPVKKKKFSDDILIFDDRHDSEEEEESGQENANSDEEVVESDSDEPLIEYAKGASNNIEEEDESGEEEGEVDDDPERLWCLCQKPHNNRFMICCDRCEDWFHGSCVGISKQMGKKMEDEEREWICPNCKKTERAVKGLASSPATKKTKTKLSPRKGDEKQSAFLKSSSKTEHRVLVYNKYTGVVLSGTAAPVLTSLQEWLSGHPDYACLSPAMMKVIEEDSKTGVKRVPLECLTPKSNKGNKVDSDTSPKKKSKSLSTKLLDQAEVVRLEAAKRAEEEKSKKSSKEEKQSKKVSSSSSSFYGKQERKSSLDKLDESFSKKSSKEAKKPAKTVDHVDKVVVKSDSIIKVRTSVQKMLFEALDKRRVESKSEFQHLSAENVKTLCKDIEEQLYLVFNKDVGFKYKSRYRSLVFNIRDTKNGGLFRNILTGSVPPDKLACMTSEEMASKELVEWRQKEGKKEIEAIQKHELERIALGNQYIMKSHKGEIVIDKDEFSSKTKDTESVINLAPDASNVLPSKDLEDDETQNNHKNHIYDPNCKICASSHLHEFAKNKQKHELKKDEKREKKDRHESSKEKKRDRSKDRRSDKHDRHRHKDKRKEKNLSSTDEEREKRRHHSGSHKKPKEHNDRRDSYDKSRKHHKDRKSSHDEKESRRSKDLHKRKHSESRSEDNKRRSSARDSESSFLNNSEVGKSPKTSESDMDIEQNSRHNRKNVDSTKTMYKVYSVDSPTANISSITENGGEAMSLSPDDSEKVTAEHISYSPDIPSTPPLPTETEVFSPATPPLPDDDEEEEDRLTPPPPSSSKSQLVEKNLQMPIWRGYINMMDVAKFGVASFEVSGKAVSLTGEVPSVMEVVGRVNPDNVWAYISEQKKSGSKEILVVRFQPSNEEEKASYIAFYSYMSNKRRYGVIGNCGKLIKDFYIVPLASHQPIPQILLPLDGPGFEECRPHMLIGVIVRTKRRKMYDPLTETWITNEVPKSHTRDTDDANPPLDPDDSVDERSYTPPPTTVETKPVEILADDQDSEVYSPPSDETSLPEDEKIKEEPEDRLDRESMLAELNRQIEKDRKELTEMQKKVDKEREDSETKQEIRNNVETSNVESGGVSLDTSKINIPSNLHEILNSIKQKEEAIKEKENEIKRRLNMANEDSGTKDVDLRLLLPQKPNSISMVKDQDMRVLGDPLIPRKESVADSDLRSRDPRMLKGFPIAAKDDGIGSLSSMSDADLLAKAHQEMDTLSSSEGPHYVTHAPPHLPPDHPPPMPPLYGPPPELPPPGGPYGPQPLPPGPPPRDIEHPHYDYNQATMQPPMFPPGGPRPPPPNRGDGRDFGPYPPSIMDDEWLDRDPLSNDWDHRGRHEPWGREPMPDWPPGGRFPPDHNGRGRWPVRGHHPRMPPMDRDWRGRKDNLRARGWRGRPGPKRIRREPGWHQGEGGEIDY